MNDDFRAAVRRLVARERMRLAARYDLVNPYEQEDGELLAGDTPEREARDLALAG